MPWTVKKDDRCPTNEPWGVVKDDDNELEGCHSSKDAAAKQQAALYANEGRSMPNTQPPRDNLVRAMGSALQLRTDGDDPAGMPILEGHFARFNEWTEIDSVWEGRFMERIVPGAFSDTIEQHRDRMRILFQHGQDPQIGDKPLAPIEELGEDELGGFYRGRMLDTSYNRDLVPGLKAGQYGSSFRFSVIDEELNNKPKRSDYNPEGLPERTVKQARLFEFGPVTFPAYAGATAGVRSMTDRFTQYKPRAESPSEPDRLQPERLNGAPTAQQGNHSTLPTPETKTVTEEIKRMAPEERVSRLGEIKNRQAELNTEYHDMPFPPEVKAEWDALKKERADHEAFLEELEERKLDIAEERVPQTRTDGYRSPTILVPPSTRDIYDVDSVRSQARSSDEERQMLNDHAKRAVEIASFPQAPDRSWAQEHVTKLVENDSKDSVVSKLILTTGSPTYSRAFEKALLDGPRTNDEQTLLYRALSLTGASGGFAVPFDLDPTIIPTSNGVVNPIRRLARVVQTTVDTWRGVSSGAVTASYKAEASEMNDDAPTLTQPEISTERADSFIPFSYEIGMDWPGFRGEMATLIQDAKDALEAGKFLTGTGTLEPFGLLVGVTNTVNAAAGADTFTLDNVLSLTTALPPRYRPRAAWLGNLAILNRIRTTDVSTKGGGIWQDSLQADVPDRLLGRAIYEASEMPGTALTGNKFLVYGDFSRYVIVDRIGMTIELVPQLFGANRRPTGQRGIVAYWRNGAKVVDANAFRALVGTA